MRVALTGATGFIGRRLQRQLLRAGHRVSALVRPRQVARRTELLPGVEQRPFDHTSAEQWRAFLADEPPQALMLLAGAVRGRRYADFARVNEHPMAALAEALTDTPAPRLLLLSSLAASEPGLSHYSASKRAGEIALGSALTPVTILRPPAVYGPGDVEMRSLFQCVRAGLLPRLGPPDQRISFLHVDDLARAMEAWLHVPGEDTAGTFTLHDGHAGGYSWQEIATAIAPDRRVAIVPVPEPLLHSLATANLMTASLLRYAPMLTPGKVRELVHREWLCDNRSFSAITGWRPDLDLATGCAITGDPEQQ